LSDDLWEEYGGEGDGDIWKGGGEMGQNEEDGGAYDCEEDWEVDKGEKELVSSEEGYVVKVESWEEADDVVVGVETALRPGEVVLVKYAGANVDNWEEVDEAVVKEIEAVARLGEGQMDKYEELDVDAVDRSSVRGMMDWLLLKTAGRGIGLEQFDMIGKNLAAMGVIW
jgi:hypothetical protein